jgi:hypothetical protein
MQVMEFSQKRSSKKRRKRAEILELLQEFEKSEMTVKDFGKLHNISTGILYQWKNRYKSDDNKTIGFAKVNIKPSLTDRHGLFAEVRGIRIYQPVSATFLKELLA